MGGPRLLELLGVSLPEDLEIFTHQSNQKGQSTVYLASEKQVVVTFALADVIRPESKEAINKLHALGMGVAMLTGDSAGCKISSGGTWNRDLLC
jgi:P-type Cu2+ transporter